MVSPETYCYQTETAPEPARTAASGADTEIPAVTQHAVDLLVSGQEITGGQAERIARSPEAVALLSQLTGTEVAKIAIPAPSARDLSTTFTC